MTKQRQIVVLLLLAAITAALTPVIPDFTVIFWFLAGIFLVGAGILALKMYGKKP